MSPCRYKEVIEVYDTAPCTLNGKPGVVFLDGCGWFLQDRQAPVTITAVRDPFGIPLKNSAGQQFNPLLLVVDDRN
jgi:hypothetical protein